MNICVLGFGHVGSQMVRLWAAAGHALTVGLRDQSARAEEVKAAGAKASDPQSAAQSADVVALALPWPAMEETLLSLGSLKGKVVLDATNPLGKDLSVLPLDGSYGAEQVAKWLPGARVVKAFNTIGAMYYGDPTFDILYCGDDAEAKATVRSLIADTSMRPVDVGPLKNARYMEHFAGLWVDLALNGRVQGPFGFNLVSKKQ